MVIDRSRSIVTRNMHPRIAAIAACVPQNIIENSQFVDSFGAAAEQIIKMTGVQRRHIVSSGQTTSDLCVAASQAIFSETDYVPEDIDAIIFFSQTPDYRLPATACDIQLRLGLRAGIIAYDVNLGCSAYPYALWMGSLIINSGAATRVLLCVGDTISRIVAPEDRATAMLFGDCGTATILEGDAQNGATFVLGSDGSGVKNLIVPEGCFRTSAGVDPRHTATPDKLFMDGGEIFNFTLKAVPGLFAELCEAAHTDAECYEKVLFHQANAFMINHLRKKIKVAVEKVPVNIAQYGNTSSASIPLLMITECHDLLLSKNSHTVAMLGFGVGYSWAAVSMDIGNLACATLVEL